MNATGHTTAAMLKLQRILASLLAALILSVLALTWSVQQRRRAA